MKLVGLFIQLTMSDRHNKLPERIKFSKRIEQFYILIKKKKGILVTEPNI